MPAPADLQSAFDAAGQAHLLEGWDQLDPEQRAAYEAQLREVDLAQLAELRALMQAPPKAAGELSPTEVTRWPLTDAQRAERIALGEAALREGKVACLTVAGGQGSRLGYDGPKGEVGVGPVSGASLFRIFAGKLQRLEARYGVKLPWLLMTSEATDAATRARFEADDFYGLDREQVRFFRQGMLPALDGEGRLVRDRPGHLFTSPNGHGGTLAALRDSGQLDALEAAGVELLFYFQVDNPLLVLADPLFLGEHLLREAELSTKVVKKTGPDEKVGVLGRIDGAEGLVEYSDLDDATRVARDATGELLFWAGNIAVHVFDVAFLRRISAEPLPLHVARKQLPQLGADGQIRKVDGAKFERFIFDALPLARKVTALEVVRAREFAPVKNASGTDSLESAQAMLTAEYARWLEALDYDVPRGDDGAPVQPLEIDPRVAAGPEDLPATLELDWTQPVLIAP